MRRAYSRIAWGLLIALIDFRLGGVDVLPDFIGYALVMAGLAYLKPSSSRYRIAWYAAGGLLVLSLLPLLGIRLEVSLTSGERPTLSLLALSSLAAAVELVLAYGLCEGIRQSARERGRVGLAGRAKSIWDWTFIIGVVLLFAFPFQLNYELGEVWPILAILSLAMLLMGVLLIFLVRRAGRELSRGAGRIEGETPG